MEFAKKNLLVVTTIAAVVGWFVARRVAAVNAQEPTTATAAAAAEEHRGQTTAAPKGEPDNSEKSTAEVQNAVQTSETTRGQPFSDKKLNRIAQKEAAREAHRQARAEAGRAEGAALTDRAALISNQLWQAVSASLPSPQAADRQLSRDDLKILRQFYTHAYKGDVVREHLTEHVARAFTATKWSNRCDQMACALIAAKWEAPARRGQLHVASVGGGPANDACGFLVFSALQPWVAAGIKLTVYDFTEVWEPIVHSIAGCDEVSNLGATDNTELDFELCDLQAPIDAQINQHILANASTISYWLFSHVVHEARACQFPLMLEIMHRARAGSKFIVLEAFAGDLDLVSKQAMQVQDGFEVVRIGGSKDTTFAGLAMTKL